MKRLPIFIFIIFVLVVMPSVCLALPDTGCDPFDPACPIDGGLSLLIAAGIGLGAKKAFKERKKALDTNP